MPCLLRFASAAVAAAISSSAVAQLPYETRCVHAWPGLAPAGELNPALARLCRFDAASGVDAVVLRTHELGPGTAARELFVLREIGRTHAAVSLGGAIDFVVVGADVNAQAVIALGVDGVLRLVRWPAAAAQPVTTQLAVWPGFRRLAAVRTGATTELFGFDTASVRMRRAVWSGTQLSPSSLVFVPPNVTFVEAMDWDHDGVPELVLSTPAATFVQAWNLAPLPNPPALPLATAALNATWCVSRSAAGHDQLVTVSWDGAATIVTWANATTLGALSLGPHPVACVVTYDRDGDGDDDVLLGDAQHSIIHILLRETWGYSTATARLVVGPTAPDAGIGAVTGGDIDGDDDGDIVAFHHASTRVQTWFDASRPPQRLVGLRVDVTAVAPGPVAALPFVATLPINLQALHPGVASFRVCVDGWLVDPVAGSVAPERVVAFDAPIDPEGVEIAGMLSLSLPPAQHESFHLQLAASLVAVGPAGDRRRLPSAVMHVITPVTLEPDVWPLVGEELFGDPAAKHPHDGGGDGNILGVKTGRHEVGAPPR